ncbi:MAG: nucleoside triphosphate pyrophosphohydrolase [Coriobacteriales bacterium]|jgi:tetrapyrrole methylase family protein/MazG family protein|nr:nucleoside triphosphate pyrophosphohydrolase [Coriobacteriales bacterium]
MHDNETPHHKHENPYHTHEEGSERCDHAHAHDDGSLDTCDAFSELVAIVALLRSEEGCPWDREQTHESIAKNMIEEAYEAVEAIEQGSVDALREELGDVLLQVVLHAQIAADDGEFTLEEVIQGISNKLISRHPHVFGNEASFAAAGFTDAEIALIEEASDAESTLRLWDRMKTLERQRKAQASGDAGPVSLLASVPKAEPALMQAQNISRKAAAQGFEWEDIEGLTDKLAEEFEEFAQAEGDSPEAEEEFGDILFTLVNIARWNNIDAETALRRSCEKFRTRWAAMEGEANERGFNLRTLDEQGWDELWSHAKLEQAS